MPTLSWEPKEVRYKRFDTHIAHCTLSSFSVEWVPACVRVWGREGNKGEEINTALQNMLFL